MAVFPSKPLNERTLNRTVRRFPALFGVPFVLIMVAASYGLSTFTQTRYDLYDQRVKQVCVTMVSDIQMTGAHVA